MLYFSSGEQGVCTTDGWQNYNKDYWQGQLRPTPFFLPNATPYRCCWGACVHSQGQVINIQIKYGLDDRAVCKILLHEMVHTALDESELNPNQNDEPWCKEIYALVETITKSAFGRHHHFPEKLMVARYVCKSHLKVMKSPYAGQISQVGPNLLVLLHLD